MATVDQINQLRRSVDGARELAIALDMTTTAHILAMACLDIAEKLDDETVDEPGSDVEPE